MNLLDIVTLEQLQKTQDTFSNATGLAAITVDLNGNFITKPSNFTDFCMKYTKGSPLGKKRCAKCDAEGKGTYFCHAGLMDFSEPIIINGIHMANILGGQVLSKEPDIEKFEAIAEELQIPKREYIAALKKVPIKSEASIHAAANLLKELISLLVNNQYHLNTQEQQLSVVSEKIEDVLNASKEITSKTDSLKKISSQQNILSLNASIEAARSGEAGKGFVIVAKQMGELAHNSASIYDSIISDAVKISAAAAILDKAFQQK